MTWTKRFKKIADDAWHVSASSAIIDGEVVVSAADGTTDFSVLQNELKGRSTKIVMVAFDLLYFNGYDLRKLPLFQSKELLKKLIVGTAIQFSEVSRLTARRCISRPEGPSLRALFRRCKTANTRRPIERLGQRKRARKEKRSPSPDLRSTAISGMAST
jgi:ATP dependent DNA ligase-like protein